MNAKQINCPQETYKKVIDWINVSDFKETDSLSCIDTDALEKLTDITSVSREEVAKHREKDKNCQTETKGTEDEDILEAKTRFSRLIANYLDSNASDADTTTRKNCFAAEGQHILKWNSENQKLVITEVVTRIICTLWATMTVYFALILFDFLTNHKDYAS